MHEEVIQELIKEHKQSTNQLTYYLMAISTACIGFTIHFIITNEDKKILYILLGSILCWALSFYNGYKRIEHLIEYVRANAIGLETLDELRVTGGKSFLEDKFSHLDKKQAKNYKWQIRFLGIGFLLFFIWLIIDIYWFK